MCVVLEEAAPREGRWGKGSPSCWVCGGAVCVCLGESGSVYAGEGLALCAARHALSSGGQRQPGSGNNRMVGNLLQSVRGCAAVLGLFAGSQDHVGEFLGSRADPFYTHEPPNIYWCGLICSFSRGEPAQLRSAVTMQSDRDAEAQRQGPKPPGAAARDGFSEEQAR